MIIGRIGQGFAGGAMIPTAQTIVRTRLPPHQMPIGMTLFGMIVLTGPLLGPVLGGSLAERIDWSWCFFVNVPVGVALIALLYAGLPKSPHDWHQFVNADWLGIIGLSAGLSSLTVVLEEGQRDNWFDSRMIVWLSVLAVEASPRWSLGNSPPSGLSYGWSCSPIRVMRASFSSSSWWAPASTACPICYRSS